MLNPNGLHMPAWNNDSKKQSPLFICTEKFELFYFAPQLPMDFQLSERVRERKERGGRKTSIINRWICQLSRYPLDDGNYSMSLFKKTSKELAVRLSPNCKRCRDT